MAQGTTTKLRSPACFAWEGALQHVLAGSGPKTFQCRAVGLEFRALGLQVSERMESWFQLPGRNTLTIFNQQINRKNNNLDTYSRMESSCPGRRTQRSHTVASQKRVRDMGFCPTVSRILSDSHIDGQSTKPFFLSLSIGSSGTNSGCGL